MKEDLVGKHENEAIHIHLNHVNGKGSNNEEKFTAVIKKSTSADTISFGIIVAVDAEWHEALEELLSIDFSEYNPDEFESDRRHPLQSYAFSLFSLPPANGVGEKGGYVNAALMHAVASGKVETVKIMAKHMDLNIDDVYCRPLLHYVYLLGEQDLRKKIMDIVLPKLNPSFVNICTTAKHGDLESTKYIVENLTPKDRYLVAIAGRIAIQSGHDDITKWIVKTPGLMNWDIDMGSLVDAAIKCNNLDIIEYLSTYSPALLPHQLGYSTASDLWDFLQRVNHPELFDKFIPTHSEGYSL